MDIIRTADTLTETMRRRDALMQSIAQLGTAYASATGTPAFEAMRAADGITIAAGDGPNLLRVRLRALPFDAGAEWVITDAYGDEGAMAQVFVRAALAKKVASA